MSDKLEIIKSHFEREKQKYRTNYGLRQYEWLIQRCEVFDDFLHELKKQCDEESNAEVSLELIDILIESGDV